MIMSTKTAQSFLTNQDGENYIVTFAHSMIACGTLWARLEREFVTTPYQKLDFCRSWYQAQAEPKPVPCSLLVSDTNGTPLLFLVLAIEQRQGLRIASFMGGTHMNFAVPLFRPEHRFSAGTLTGIFAQLAHAAEIDAFYLDKMPASWAGHKNPLLALPHRHAADKAYWHHLRSDAETTLASMRSPSHLKQLQAKRRKLDEIGYVESCEAVMPADRAHALKVFFNQKSLWCRHAAVPDVFGEAETQKFIVSLASSSNALRIFTLNVSGVVQAVFLALEHQNRLCGWASSYDHGAISAFSPGDLLLQHVIGIACLEGIEILDLGAGDGAYKKRWLHEEEPLHAAILGYGWRGRAAAQMLSLKYALKSTVKKSPHLYRALQKLRS